MLFDSLFSRLPELPGYLSLTVSSEDSSIKAVAEERAILRLAKTGNKIVDDSPNKLIIKVTSFALAFPKATKRGLFSTRIIEREAYAKIFVQVMPEFTAYEDEQFLSDSFPENMLDYVNSTMPFVAYPKSRTFVYYLWEPVLIAIFTVGLAYVFFAVR